jgi:hypothetical protein
MTTNAWDLCATALSLVFFNMDKHTLTPAKLLNLLQSVLMEISTKHISFKQWSDKFQRLIHHRKEHFITYNAV